MKTYTNQEIRFILDNKKNCTYKELAELFMQNFTRKVSANQLKCFYNRHKNWDGKKINPSQFKKGCIPWNKGKKMSKETYEKSKATFFKPGHKPATTMPVGSTRTDKNGTQHIKIIDKDGKEKWIRKNRYMYEQLNGEIKESDRIIFADGDKTNYSKDNLIAVKQGDLAMMGINKLFFKDKELTKAAVAVAKIVQKCPTRKRKEVKK